MVILLLEVTKLLNNFSFQAFMNNSCFCNLRGVGISTYMCVASHRRTPDLRVCASAFVNCVYLLADGSQGADLFFSPEA